MLSSRAILLIIIAILLSSCKSQITNESEDSTRDESRRVEPIYFDVINIRGGPVLDNYWPNIPRFTFCKSSKITNTRAHNAISYWKRLGYPIAEIEYKVDDLRCMSDPMFGEVMVKLVTSDIPLGQNIAVTRIHYNTNTKEISGATIFVLGGFANHERLLEHEIGHALGWGHYSRNLHIMHPHYPRTGHDSSGLRYEKYKSSIEDIKFHN